MLNLRHSFPSFAHPQPRDHLVLGGRKEEAGNKKVLVVVVVVVVQVTGGARRGSSIGSGDWDRYRMGGERDGQVFGEGVVTSGDDSSAVDYEKSLLLLLLLLLLCVSE
ncbi:hypothetical protein Pmani_003878 [Petrolisthes manimaculis]|uniref:Uncharacterized protein n=1 Tax=Petrolisthes manimaculis TaxID=1843537 RepID=A0AAE1QER5_9EUCA|nr:hypothetical protein Pmani_003878 [Petrolisthes manimaculis]